MYCEKPIIVGLLVTAIAGTATFGAGVCTANADRAATVIDFGGVAPLLAFIATDDFCVGTVVVGGVFVVGRFDVDAVEFIAFLITIDVDANSGIFV